MAKMKRTKGQTTFYKTLHIKLKIDQQEPHSNIGERRCSGRVGSSCSTSVTNRVNLQNTTHTTKDLVTRTSLKHWWTRVLWKGRQFLLNIGELMCSGRVGSSWSISVTCGVNLQNTTHTTKDRSTRTTLKHWWTQVLQKGRQFLIH